MKHFIIASLSLLVAFSFQPAFADETDDLLKDLDAEMQPETSGDDSLDLLNDLDSEMEPSGKTGGDDDLLGMLDEPEEKPKAKPMSKTRKLMKKLADNLGGEVRLRLHNFWHDYVNNEHPNADKTKFVVDSRVEVSTFTGTGDWRFTVSGWGEAGAQRETYKNVSEWMIDNERRRREGELSEAYLQLFEEEYDLTIGRKTFENGLSTLYSPANRYNYSDSNDPTDSKEIGIWLLQVDYYRDDITYTGAVMPAYQYSKTPYSGSRWTNSEVFYVPDLDSAEGSGSSSLPVLMDSQVTYFGRAKTTHKGWDLFASASYGPYTLFVDRNEERSSEIIEKIHVASGFSTTKKKWEFHGEASYAIDRQYRDHNYVSYVAGATYKIDDDAEKLYMERIDIIVEYSGEWVTGKQRKKEYEATSQDVNDVIARITLKYNEDLSFHYNTTYQLHRHGFYQNTDAKYRLKEGFFITVALEEFDGRQTSNYGPWDENDRLITTIEYSF